MIRQLILACSAVAGVATLSVSAHAALMVTEGIVAAIAVSETEAGGNSTSTLSFPGGENPTLAFDGTTSTKFLTFAGTADDGDASDAGVILIFTRPVTIEALRFGFANDGPERDPTNFTLEGSNTFGLSNFASTGELLPGVIAAAPETINDSAEWTAIVGGSAGAPGRTGLAEDTDLFIDAVNSRLMYSDETPFNRSATAFTNTTAYSAYRLLLPDLRLPGNGIMQVGEIELLASDPIPAIPEPTTLAIAASCLAGLGLRRRA